MFRRFGSTARPRRATASLSPEAARRHAARETSAAHKAPALWVSGWSFSASPVALNLGAAPGVPLVVASPARTLRASLSSTASRGGGVPNASRDASRALASCSCHPRRRSSSKTYAAASLGFAGHDAPGSPCASAFFAARRKRVTTSSTSRGSRVAHASTSHDGGGGRLSAAPIALVGSFYTPTTRGKVSCSSPSIRRTKCATVLHHPRRALRSLTRARAERPSAEAHRVPLARAVGASGWQTWRRRCPTPTSA